MNYISSPHLGPATSQHSQPVATIGLPESLAPMGVWAQKLGLDPIFTAVLDATKTDLHEKYFGTVIHYLQQKESAALLRTWADELQCADDLSRLSEALLISPLVAAYPAMPSSQAAAIQLRGSLAELRLVALIARPIVSDSPEEQKWLSALRMWVFVSAVNAIYQRGTPNDYLNKVTDKLRLAIDQDFSYADWKVLFTRLKSGATSFHDITRSMAANAKLLRNSASNPVQSSSHLQLLSNLRAFCEGKSSDTTQSDGVAQGRFGRIYREGVPLRSGPSTVQYGDTIWPPFASLNEHGSGEGPITSLYFDPLGADESVIEAVSVEETKTPLEQLRQATGILLSTAEDNQFLPFSWNRLTKNEHELLADWIWAAQEGIALERQALATFVDLALKTAYSLDTVLPIPLSYLPTPDWSINLEQECLHRLRPQRHNGWKPSAEAEKWIEARIPVLKVALSTATVRVLRRLLLDAPESSQLGLLWPKEVADTPARLFRETCQGITGLERLRSGMLTHVLEQRIFEETEDPVLSHLLASHPRTGLGGACAYASYQNEIVQKLLSQSDLPVSHAQNYFDPELNAAGSELDPLDEALQSACCEALAKVNELASHPARWMDYHNALTAYVVVMVLAATAARPVNSPFESIANFDWVQASLYTEDKVSSNLRQGRLLPLPESLIALLRECYLPHLEWMAKLTTHCDAPLSKALEQSVAGIAQASLPFFFLIGMNLTKEGGLRWFEVTETSLSALEVFSWPLPWNLMRHRLPTTLKRAGQNHEAINGLTGHSENGTATYGPYSMRVWQQDALSLRLPLDDALAKLTLEIPAKPLWELVPLPATGSSSCIDPDIRFGSLERSRKRQANHLRARKDALEEILKFVSDRPIDSLSPGDWESLSKQMLVHQDGRPRALGSIRYETLQQWIAENWQKNGLSPRIKRRYLSAVEEESPFSARSVGCLDRVKTALQTLNMSTADLQPSRASQRDALGFGILHLVIESRVGSPRIIKDLLQGKNFRLVQFQQRFHIEYSPGLDKLPLVAVQRYEIGAIAAALLAKAKSATYTIDLRKWTIPKALTPIGKMFGLEESAKSSFEAFVLAIALDVRQANFLTYPGLVAGYLNGDLISAGLHHADWVRVVTGVAVRTEPLRPVPPAADTKSASEHKLDDELPDAIDDAYLPHRDAFLNGRSTKNATLANESDLKKTSFELFRSIRSALNDELRSKAPSRRNLDSRLRALISSSTGRVGRSCLLLAEWQRSLLWRKTRKGLIRIRSLQRYLNALSPCFQAIAYDHNLLDCDAEDVTEFYRKVMEIRSLINPGESEKTTPATEDVASTEVQRADISEYYRTQKLALQLLRDFHRLVSREFAVEDPDWSEIVAGDDLLSISPGILTETEYLYALRSLAPKPHNAERLDLARAFILLTMYRFGLRGAEVTGLMRADWVQYPKNAIVILVRGNRIRSLKSTAGQRQVPLVFPLDEHEQQVIDSWLMSFEGITALDGKGPLFAEQQMPEVLMNGRQLVREVGQIMKQITGNSEISPHHARHAFANQVALLLIEGTSNIWPTARLGSMRTTTHQHHVRQLLLCTTQVTRRTLWALARLLGHAHPNTTVKSYLHLLPELSAAYVGLSPATSISTSKHLKGNCTNLGAMVPVGDYLTAAPLRPSEPRAATLDADRAIRFLHLCQRGYSIQDAQEIVRIFAKDASELAESVQVIDGILARRPAINPSMGGRFNLLSHIPESRWRVLTTQASSVHWDAESLRSATLTFEHLPQLIGSSRQVVMWKTEHFRFFKAVVDAWHLGNASYQIHSTSSGTAELQKMAAEAGLEMGQPLSTSTLQAKQIDIIEVGDPPLLVRHRCAGIARTDPDSVLRSSYELLLLMLVSIALQSARQIE